LTIRSSTLSAQIGNTPLVDLGAFAAARGVCRDVHVFAKIEWMNPGGSVKARAALRMLDAGEAGGALRPGKIIIDSSSGNTGIALAMLGAERGYSVHLVMPANVSVERKALVQAFGALLIESDPLEGSDGALRLVRKIVNAAPGRYCFIDQYNNPANWQAHYHTTGPEIWRQTSGNITHFVAGLGTTGTFTGVGRFLKQMRGEVARVEVQPDGPFHGLEGLKHMASALVPAIYEPDLPTRRVGAPTEPAFEAVRRLARHAGLLVGPSAGAAVWAAIEVARELERGVVVTVLCDSGTRYLSDSHLWENA